MPALDHLKNTFGTTLEAMCTYFRVQDMALVITLLFWQPTQQYSNISIEQFFSGVWKLNFLRSKIYFFPIGEGNISLFPPLLTFCLRAGWNIIPIIFTSYCSNRETQSKYMFVDLLSFWFPAVAAVWQCSSRWHERRNLAEPIGNSCDFEFDSVLWPCHL